MFKKPKACKDFITSCAKYQRLASRYIGPCQNMYHMIAVSGTYTSESGRHAGMTPFAAWQWGPFLARVAGLAIAQQFLRPLRFSAAMAITPFVDRMMGSLQNRFTLSKRQAFGVMFVSLAVVTTAGFAVALTTATVWNMPAKA